MENQKRMREAVRGGIQSLGGGFSAVAEFVKRVEGALAHNGIVAHQNLKDSLHEFSREGDDFKLKLKAVITSDAGKIFCNGETTLEFILSVAR